MPLRHDLESVLVIGSGPIVIGQACEFDYSGTQACRAARAYGESPPLPLSPALESVLVIGSGPIVIGQACEFDYSGTQACRVLRSEGLRVILINSNPATIMTDPDIADATYVEPID